MIRVDGRAIPRSLIRVRGLNKTYSRGAAARNPGLTGSETSTGQRATWSPFMGPSGLRKTTLLNLLGGLDVPSAAVITSTADESRTCRGAS